jgi:hypothetical protein
MMSYEFTTEERELIGHLSPEEQHRRAREMDAPTEYTKEEASKLAKLAEQIAAIEQSTKHIGERLGLSGDALDIWGHRRAMLKMRMTQATEEQKLKHEPYVLYRNHQKLWRRHDNIDYHAWARSQCLI